MEDEIKVYVLTYQVPKNWYGDVGSALSVLKTIIIGIQGTLKDVAIRHTGLSIIKGEEYLDFEAVGQTEKSEYDFIEKTTGLMSRIEKINIKFEY